MIETKDDEKISDFFKLCFEQCQKKILFLTKKFE